MIVLAFTKLHPLLPIRHVALVHGDQIIESSGFPVRGLPAGVRMRNLFDFMQQHPDMELRVIRHSDPEGVWDKCLSQVGKPYDWRWYVGMLSGSRKWQDDGAWVCHEMIVWALGFNWRTTWIRPAHLYAFTEGE